MFDLVLPEFMIKDQNVGIVLKAISIFISSSISIFVFIKLKNRILSIKEQFYVVLIFAVLLFIFQASYIHEVVDIPEKSILALSLLLLLVFDFVSIFIPVFLVSKFMKNKIKENVDNHDEDRSRNIFQYALILLGFNFLINVLKDLLAIMFSLEEKLNTSPFSILLFFISLAITSNIFIKREKREPSKREKVFFSLYFAFFSTVAEIIGILFFDSSMVNHFNEYPLPKLIFVSSVLIIFSVGIVYMMTYYFFGYICKKFIKDHQKL